MRDGFRFTIGSQSFIVRTKRWSWLREAEKVEMKFNRRLAEEENDEARMKDWFLWYVIGLLDTDTRADAVLDPLPATEGEGVIIP